MGGSATPATTSAICWTLPYPTLSARRKYEPGSRLSNPNAPLALDLVVTAWALSSVMVTLATGRMTSSTTNPRMTPVVSVTCRPKFWTATSSGGGLGPRRRLRCSRRAREGYKGGR